MWICTKCETFNEETSLVCCVCGNRRGNADAKCDTTRLESNFKSSMDDADTNSSKKHDHVRIPKPDRDTYKIKEGQDSADIPKELRPEKPMDQKAPADTEQAPAPVQEEKPQTEGGDISIMPEPQPFSDNFENPFGTNWSSDAPPPDAPAEPQNTAAAPEGKKTNLLPFIAIGAVAAVAVIAVILIMLNQ